MKRLVLVGVLALLVLACALELAARAGGLTTILAPHDVFVPERRGWCGGAWLETDASGQRRGAAAWLAAPRGRSIVAVGGPFTAGAGLEDDELWTARLEARVKGGGFERVVGFAFPRRKAAEITRLLPQLARDDVLVLELDARDVAGDPEPFEIRAPVRALPAVARSSSAALKWLRLLALRRERGRLEDEIAALVARDGFTGRASSRSSLRLEALTRAANARQLDDEQAALLRAWLAEFHGLSRSEVRAERLDEWRALFDALRAAQRPTLVLVTGPTPPAISLTRLVHDCAFPLRHAAPFELDPDLRIDVPPQRPAAVVHAQAADSIWTLLAERGLVTATVAPPAAVVETTAAIQQQVLSRGGYDEACLTLARMQVGSDVTFGAGPPPVGALAGIGPGGGVVPDVPAELVLRRPPFPQELIVRARVAGAVAPRLSLRHGLGGAGADPAAVASRGSSADGLFEWRFEPPLARSPVDYTALELTCLPLADGSSGPSLELRDVRYTLAPTPDDGQ